MTQSEKLTLLRRFVQKFTYQQDFLSGQFFFSVIILITQTYKTKNITTTRYYFIYPVPRKKENSKLKQSEIEVKMVIKMKKT